MAVIARNVRHEIAIAAACCSALIIGAGIYQTLAPQLSREGKSVNQEFANASMTEQFADYKQGLVGVDCLNKKDLNIPDVQTYTRLYSNKKCAFTFY